MTYAASRNPVADHAYHRWTPRPQASVDRLNESEFAWVVQTGKESAEEAVAAIMVTFLQQAASHAGFVAGASLHTCNSCVLLRRNGTATDPNADVESVGKVKLADTSHVIERWSLARWEDAWPSRSLGSDQDQQDAQAEMESLRHGRPSFPHKAHKVLPGFKLMHKKWPAAKWYIMIDDDTFIFRRALAKLLSSLDSQDKHYIGYPRHGANMCRDPGTSEDQEVSDGPFALGGCGMVLSRGAIERLAQVVVECTIASQDCYLDDVRLFFCLKLVGIRLNTSINYPAMNYAPNKNIDWGRIDPCAHPVVFHGVRCFAKAHAQLTSAALTAQTRPIPLCLVHSLGCSYACIRIKLLPGLRCKAALLDVDVTCITVVCCLLHIVVMMWALKPLLSILHAGDANGDAHAACSRPEAPWPGMHGRYLCRNGYLGCSL